MSVDLWRKDFPILTEQVGQNPLVYFDNGATTQKPLSVLERMQRFYMEENANVHRAVHALSERATIAYEHARQNIADWIGASDPHELVFVRGATEAINLLSHGLSQSWQAGDEVIVSIMEHHANFVPWFRLAEQKGIVIKVAPIDQSGQLDLDALGKLFSKRTKLLAMMHVSNVLGTVNPIETIAQMAHSHDVPILVDGAQAMPHMQIDVQKMDVDYYVFSGHKMYGPTGIGVCYAKKVHWDCMPLYQSGGEMIEYVTLEQITYKAPPFCFEAGTPNVVGSIGLSASVDYLRSLDLSAVRAHEDALSKRLTQGLLSYPGLRIFGEDPHKAPIVSFAVEGQHPLDIATLLDGHGIALRSGHHCAMPLLQSLGQSGLVRASLGLYNTQEEVDCLIEKVGEVLALLRGA